MMQRETQVQAPDTTSTSRLLRAAGAAVVAVYFLRFNWGGLWVGFASDDPMNLHYYWSHGAGELLRNLGLFFTGYYRPMGGVYYLSLFHFFGLNPLPYHVATMCLLALNAFLAYRFARLLTGSRIAAGLCALVVSYHAGLARLMYLPSFIYDVLCFTFYFSALNYYLAIRTRGGRLKAWQIGVFALLYIGALTSKEMAVSLPVVVLLYEVIWHRPTPLSLKNVARWVATDALPALAAAVVTGIFILGKLLSADSPLRMEAYRPTVTLDRFLESLSRFLNVLFYEPEVHGFFNPRTVLLAAALLLAIAWRTKRKHFWLMLFFVFVTPLPIAFISGRSGPCLYIPLVGWAVAAASLYAMFAETAALWLRRWRVPPAAAVATLVLCAVAAQWRLSAKVTAGLEPRLRIENVRTAEVIRQIRTVQPAVKPAARIYVFNDPFEGFDTEFLFALTYRDPTVHIWLDRHSHLLPADVARMDYVFTFENGVLKRLKGS